MRPSVEEHIRMLREFMVADRDADAADFQEWADHAAARGDERRRKMWQETADWLRARRFPWEEEAA